MRYLVRARVKPGREADLLQAIQNETLGQGSVAEGEYLRNMSEARVCADQTVRWVEVCYCPTPLQEERPYWERYFDLARVQDAHDRRKCRDENGSEPWACGECDCTARLEQKLKEAGAPFLKSLRAVNDSSLDVSLLEGSLPAQAPRKFAFVLNSGGRSIASIMANTFNLSLDTLLDAVRTTVAAVLSMLLARALKLPEYYWAPISAIVIIQSTIDPRRVSWQRFAGTALGAAVGGVIATFFPANALVYAVAIFLCGVLCALLRLRGAYRFTAITLSIVLLIAHQRPAWIVATHRFVEVSLGIAVGLALAELWPRRA